MPPIPSRTIRPATRGLRRRVPAARPVPSLARPSLARSAVPAPRPPTPSPPPALKILLAGVDKDARGDVEATVRQALGGRAASGPWSISVVNFGGKWSVTLDGPGDRPRGLSFVTDSSHFADAFRKAVDGDQAGAAVGTEPGVSPSPPTEMRDTHVCGHCNQTVLVVYELLPDEPKQLAPLACPHCWKTGHVEIGAWAAAGGDYRSEKA